VEHEVWLAIPTAYPDMAAKTLPKWKERGYRVALLQDKVRFACPHADVVVHGDRYEGWATAVNVLCKEVVPASASLIVTGGDDMEPDPGHTAQELAEQFYSRFPDGFGVMQPHGDDYNWARHYCGSPFLGRRWVDAMYGGRGPLWGGYFHNWGDYELYWVARCLGALWTRPDLTHFHDHYRRGGADERAQHESRSMIEARDIDDCRLYISRMWRGFPGHGPLGVDRRFDPEPILADPVRLWEKRMAWWLEQERAREAWNTSMERALARCAEHGKRRIALVGAGEFTRSAAAALREPPVEIACIVADRRAGSRLWGYPVVTQSEAAALGPDAALVAAPPQEIEAWRPTGPLFDGGRVEVMRVYGPYAAEKNERMARALQRLAGVGCRRVALYGAGAHTRDLGPAVGESPVPIAGIIDDDPARAGGSLFGVEIVPAERALRMGLDAVVLSSDAHEEALWRRSEAFRRAGVEVVRLYAPGAVQRAA